MAALVLNTGFFVTESYPCNSGIVEIWVQTLNTVDATDTIPITLNDWGIAPTGLLSVQNWVHTTDGSVITAEANTTAVVSGVLTVTVAAGTDNDPRVIRIVGRSIPNKYS